MFSAELRKRREERGLSLRDVEGKTGISNEMVWRYEHGVGIFVMSVKNAVLLSDFFRWDIADMLRRIRKESLSEKPKKKARPARSGAGR
jgi:predicted transcriptional regulator